MASATSTRVDFNILADVQAGDVLKLHFKQDSIGYVAYLIGMIQSGIFTSRDLTALLAILHSGDWGHAENRYVKLTVTETFDHQSWRWFQERMENRIDQLEVVYRQRPLVDISILNQADASVRFRFLPDRVDGVAELLELHELGVIDLGDEPTLTEAVVEGEWMGHGRGGHFSNRMAGDENSSYREYFVTQVVPHLEFLRS